MFFPKKQSKDAIAEVLEDVKFDLLLLDSKLEKKYFDNKVVIPTNFYEGDNHYWTDYLSPNSCMAQFKHWFPGCVECQGWGETHWKVTQVITEPGEWSLADAKWIGVPTIWLSDDAAAKLPENDCAAVLASRAYMTDETYLNEIS